MEGLTTSLITKIIIKISIIENVIRNMVYIFTLCSDQTTELQSGPSPDFI